MTTGPESIVDLGAERPGEASERVVQAAAAYGYSVVAVGPGSFRLVRARRPTWAVVMSVLFGLCGIGLLFLLVKRTEDAVITIFEDRTGTKARVVGVIDPRLGAALVTGASATTVPPSPRASTSGAVPASVPAAHRSGDELPMIPAPEPPPVPTRASPPRPASAPPSSRPSSDDGDVSVVRPSRPTVAARASLRLPNGVLIAVVRRVVIGRNPDAGLHPGAEPIVLADPSLSKSHVAIDPAVGGGVTVIDLHSTNGTALVREGAVVVCVPNQPQAAPAGSVIRLGDLEIRVEALG